MKETEQQVMEPLEERLRAVFDPILDEPIPERLLEVLRRARKKAGDGEKK